MAKSLSTLAAGLINGTQATIGGAMSPTATAAEVQGLGLVLQALARRPDFSDNVLALAFSRQVSPTDPSPPTGTNQVLPG